MSSPSYPKKIGFPEVWIPADGRMHNLRQLGLLRYSQMFDEGYIASTPYYAEKALLGETMNHRLGVEV